MTQRWAAIALLALAVGLIVAIRRALGNEMSPLRPDAAARVIPLAAAA